MLRPATPLSVLLGAAFALLLLSVLSVPIIQGIPLGTAKDTTFGVFGSCQGKKCSSIAIGYDSGTIFSEDPSNFDLPSNVRHTLSAILVVHPVAALLTLILFILAVISHVRSASHSSKYLLILFIFTVIDFVLCVLAFVIDVLLFIPHLGWGSYLVLAATIMVAISAVVSCAMRRAIVGRKSRQKKIAENAEMSGENYYNREGQPKASFGVASEPTFPALSGGNSGPNDSLPTFATFESQKREGSTHEERIPLNSRTPSNRTHRAQGPETAAYGDAAMPGVPRRSMSRDRYGNPMGGSAEGYSVSRSTSFEQMNSRSRGDMRLLGSQPGGRGDGSYRGTQDNYMSPTRGRGGYGQVGRGGYGSRGGRGNYGPPPQGAYGGMAAGRNPAPPVSYGAGAGMSYDRRPSQGEAYGSYGRRPSDPSQPYSSNVSTNQSVSGANGGYEPYNGAAAALPRAESPPPLPAGPYGPLHHDAIEMDATPVDSYSTPMEHPPPRHQYGNLRDSDTDVEGMVNLQQGRGPNNHNTILSDGGKYSAEELYVPPRAMWQSDAGRQSPRTASPYGTGRAQQPAEFPGSDAPHRNELGNYYEDTAPRFAGPGPGPVDSRPYHPQQPHREPAYEDVHATVGGARSPTGSERSNFTSISQRGVNPRWNPNPPPPVPNLQARRINQRQDMILDNPDFQMPGNSAGRPRGGGQGMIPGSAYPTGPI